MKIKDQIYFFESIFNFIIKNIFSNLYFYVIVFNIFVKWSFSSEIIRKIFMGPLLNFKTNPPNSKQRKWEFRRFLNF